MAKVTQALQNYLLARKQEHNGPDLIDGWSPQLETQVLVTSKGGEAVEGRNNTFTDGKFTWFNIRVPKKANSEPEWNDYELTWPLDYYADGIGMTGWDWVERCSRRVGFDFDAIAGHAVGVGVTDAQLAEVRQKAQELDYVEVRKSTGGAGIHLWVSVDAIPTANHHEHAALARCVLSMMSESCGFDFSQAVDACGGNMWIWHTKATPENEGLKLLKAAARSLQEKDLPTNWRDHIEVVTKQRTKIRVTGVPENELSEFEALTSGKSHVQLDDQHKRLMQKVAELGYTCVWVQDHHICQTHTFGLKRAHKELQLKGFYDTHSEGRDRGTQNCFMIPKPQGAWVVVRFSKGVVEHQLWSQDGERYTSIKFNVDPDFETACLACGGKESDGNGFVFKTGQQAAQAVKALGRKLPMSAPLDNRQATLRVNKNKKVVIELKTDRDDPEDIEGFHKPKRTIWQQVISARTTSEQNDSSISEIDEIVRSLVSPAGERAGWVTRSIDGTWVRGPKDDAKSILCSMGHSKAESDQVLGSAAFKHWTAVALPFKPEYPGNRQWNREAAQLRCLPAELDYDEKPHHPHWDQVLSHCAGDLDATIGQLEWCQKSGITCGKEYLIAWIACVIREPFEPLPYNFFFGPQNSGKSIIHEAINLLMTRGVVIADRALTNGNDFNGELEGAVVCVVEEKDISKSPHAYNRIKEWVTARTLSIRKMRQDSYSTPNTTHWIQCANNQGNCPVFKGDTRINVIYVPELETEIPKKMLMKQLEAEAPHFLRTLMDLELPRIEGRLRLPIISTHRKEKSVEIQRSSLDIFLEEMCHDAPGHFVLFGDFKKAFHQWLEPMERIEWHRNRVSRELPDRHPTGRRGYNKTCVGNLSFTPPTKELQRVTVQSGKFVPDLSGNFDL